MALDEKKLENFKNQCDAVLNALENLAETFKDTYVRMSLDELADFYSKKLDKLIIQKESDEKLKYVGGTFSIVYVTNETFSLKLELYFQNVDDEWVNVKSSSGKSVKYLKTQALNELFEKKKVSFDVEPPKERNETE